MPTKKATLTPAISLAVLFLLLACGSNSGTIQGGQKGYTNSNLKGMYTFLALGSEAPSSNQYEVGGVLVADGKGAITAGEQTYSNAAGAHADNLTGAYSIGTNGLGTITLQTGDTSIGVNGVETLSVVILSPSSGLISQFDASATSSGTLDLQTSTAMPTGGYAFSVLGARVPNNAVLAFGGVFDIDNNPSTGSISGAGSIADLAQAGANATDSPLSGSVSAPDSMGKVTVLLAAGFEGSISFDGYITSATRMQLVENDGYATSGGTAYGQGTATGSYTTPASFTGPYVFGFNGFNFAGYGTYAGVIASDGAGNLTSGLIDQEQGAGAISDTLTGTYANDGAGTGRIQTATTFGTHGAGPTIILYLAGTGNPIPVLQVDATARSAGTAYVQASGTPSFSGAYGIGYSTATLFAGQDDVNGVIAATGGSFSGTANENFGFAPATSQSISGSFSSDSMGRFTGKVTTNGTSAQCAFYFIDSARGILVQTDGDQATWGNIRQQAAP